MHTLSLRDVDLCEDVTYLNWVGREALRDFTMIAPLGPPDSYVPSWKDRNDYAFVFSFVEEFTELHHLCVGSWMQFGGAGLLSVLHAAATCMPRLKSLTIPACYASLYEVDRPVFERLMGQLQVQCKGLESLRLLFDGMPPANLLGWLGTLQDLALNSVPRLDGALPKLKSLRLYSGNRACAPDCDWGSQFPMLESLHLLKDDETALLVYDNASVPGASRKLMSIANLEHLRNLSLVLSPDVVRLLKLFQNRSPPLDSLHIEEDHPDVHKGGFLTLKKLPVVRKWLCLTVSRIFGVYGDSSQSEAGVVELLKKTRSTPPRHVQVVGFLKEPGIQALNTYALAANGVQVSLHTQLSRLHSNRADADEIFNGFCGLQLNVGEGDPSREAVWLQRCTRLQSLCFIVRDVAFEECVADLRTSLPHCKISVKRWVEYYLH